MRGWGGDGEGEGGGVGAHNDIMKSREESGKVKGSNMVEGLGGGQLRAVYGQHFLYRAIPDPSGVGPYSPIATGPCPMEEWEPCGHSCTSRGVEEEC